MKVCEKCNYDMKMHYQWFCPRCDTSVLKKETKVVGDLFKIMYHMEANGYMSKRKFWDIINYKVPSNDCYIYLYLESDEGSELDEYYKKVAELLGVEHGDKVTMWVSW